MKKIQFLMVLLGSLLGANHSLFAQNNPWGTYYRTNWQFDNPAAIDRLLLNATTPYHPDMKVTSNIRKQWIGTEGSPLTSFLSFENAPNVENGDYDRWPIRWGGQVFVDQTDIVRDMALFLNYSYEFSVANEPNKKWRLGLGGGYVFRQYDRGNIRARDGIAPDPVLAVLPNRQYFDFSAGLFYHNTKDYETFYWGVSLPTTMAFQVVSKDSTAGFLKGRLPNAHFMIGKYFSPWSSNNGTRAKIDWEPTLWLRYAPRTSFDRFLGFVPLSADLGVRVYFNPDKDRPGKVWLGGGIGSNRVLSVDTGFNLSKSDGQHLDNNMQIGLAYNQPVGKGIYRLGPSIECTFAYSWQ